MKSVMEIQTELQNAYYVAFICGEKDGYIDCCYDDELEKNRYHLRYGTDEYDVTEENEVFTFPFINGKSLSEIYADVRIEPC